MFSKPLKIKRKVVQVYNLKVDSSIKNCKIFASIDPLLVGSKVWQYYKLRFQQEFLFRDGKQFTGLIHCQSRQKERLLFQFNFSLTILSITKIVNWLSKAAEDRFAFSIQGIRGNISMNRVGSPDLLNKCIVGLGICPETTKIQTIIKI